jgi:hypothetical protein
MNGVSKNAAGITAISMNKDGSWSYYVETKNLGEEPTMMTKAKYVSITGRSTEKLNYR